MGLTEFDLVSMSFYWVLLGLTEFDWVSLSFYWVLLGFTGFYWVFVGFAELYGFSLGVTGF